MNKIEKIIFSLFILTVLLTIIFHFPGVNMILVLTACLLSFLFFFIGFAVYNNIRFRDIFKKKRYENISSLKILGSVAAGISTSMTILGILFKVMFWPGSFAYLVIGVLGLLIIMIIIVYKKTKQKTTLYDKIIFRSIVLLIIALPLVYISSQSLAAFKYRDDPEYSKAFINTMNEPDNLAYRQQLLELRKKRDIIQ